MTGYPEYSQENFPENVIGLLPKPTPSSNFDKLISLALVKINAVKLELQRKEVRQQFELLTTQEKNVLLLIAEQQPNKIIATKLNISEKTVDNHRSNIHKKLAMQGQHSLIAFATLARLFG